MNWNILGRAPSLQSVTPADLLDGPVSAINGAVMHEPTPADYWVSGDAPHYMEGRQPVGNPVVVTRWPNADQWRRAYPGLELRTYKPPPSTHMTDCLPWKSRIVNWCHWSIILALYHAWQSGARRIRFGGVSMAGDGYAYSGAKVENRYGVDHRWAEERRWLAQAMTEMHEHGSVEFDLEFKPRVYECQACGEVYRLGYVYGALSCEKGCGILSWASRAVV